MIWYCDAKYQICCCDWFGDSISSHDVVRISSYCAEQVNWWWELSPSWGSRTVHPNRCELETDRRTGPESSPRWRSWCHSVVTHCVMKQGCCVSWRRRHCPLEKRIPEAILEPATIGTLPSILASLMLVLCLNCCPVRWKEKQRNKWIKRRWQKNPWKIKRWPAHSKKLNYDWIWSD